MVFYERPPAGGADDAALRARAQTNNAAVKASGRVGYGREWVANQGGSARRDGWLASLRDYGFHLDGESSAAPRL